MSTITDRPTEAETYHPLEPERQTEPSADRDPHTQAIVNRWADVNRALKMGERLARLMSSPQELHTYLQSQHNLTDLAQQTKEAMAARKAELQMDAAREGNNDATRRALLQEKLSHDELYIDLKAKSEEYDKNLWELEQTITELKTAHSVIKLSIEADIAILNAIGAL